MIYRQGGKSFGYPIRFEVDRDLVVPDANTVKFTLEDNTGAAISGYDQLAVAPAAGATSVVVNITALANAIALPVELRFVAVEFQYVGKTYWFRDYYMLKPSLNFPVSERDVRGVLNLTDAELPDNVIDILHAKTKLQAQNPAIDFDGIVSGGDETLPFLIDAVKYFCALESISAIKMGAMSSEQADNTLFKRFDKQIDFDAIAKDLGDLLAAAIVQLTGDTTSVQPILAVATTDTDPVTGV